jgi:hypothetical protein
LVSTASAPAGASSVERRCMGVGTSTWAAVDGGAKLTMLAMRSRGSRVACRGRSIKVLLCRQRVESSDLESILDSVLEVQRGLPGMRAHSTEVEAVLQAPEERVRTIEAVRSAGRAIEQLENVE